MVWAMYFNNRNASAKITPHSNMIGTSPVIPLATANTVFVIMMLTMMKNKRITYPQVSSKRSTASNLAFLKGRSLSILLFLRSFS